MCREDGTTMGEPAPHVSSERRAPVERWGDIVSWQTLISADRTPTEGMTLGTAVLAPGAPTAGARHRHPVPEVYYVISGTGRVHVDGVEHAVDAGSAVFIPSNAWHFAVNTGAEPLRLVFAFPVDGFDEVVYEYAD